MGSHFSRQVAFLLFLKFTLKWLVSMAQVKMFCDYGILTYILIWDTRKGVCFQIPVPEEMYWPSITYLHIEAHPPEDGNKD